MRQKGHRDKKRLYKRIIDLLEKHPEGLCAFQVSTTLKENDCTIRRTYLPDLVEQGRILLRINGEKKTYEPIPAKKEEP